MTDVDQVVDDAISEQSENEAVEAEATETEQLEEAEQLEDAENEDNDADDSDDGDNTPFPKKAVNAIKRRDRRLNKLNAQYQELQQQYQQMQQQLQAQSKGAQRDNGAPNEDDFDTYGDFLKAQAVWEYQQQQQQQQQGQKTYTQQEFQQMQQQQQYAQQVMGNLETQIETYKNQMPDFEQLEAENQDIFDAIPEQTMLSLLQVEDLPLAFYTLAKEGTLDNLVDMPPAKALVAAAQAQIRGQKYLQQPQQPKRVAPKPMKGARGTAQSQKNLAEMSPDELAKWLDT